jgi:uncharacterized protein (TIGR02599 family)
MSKPLHRAGNAEEGFTLVELLVSVGLITLIALLLASMTNATASTWRYTTGRIEQFRSAEMAFEAVTRRLSQATLNTYWDYDNPAAPRKYVRQSDLRFSWSRPRRRAVRPMAFSSRHRWGLWMTRPTSAGWTTS